MPIRPSLARLSPFERVLAAFTVVRPGEGRAVFHLLVSGFLLMFSYYLLKPVREALILSEGDAELRAYTIGIVAVTLVFVVPLYAQLFRGLTDPRRKSRILRWVIGFFMTNLLGFWILGTAGVDLGIPYFVWLSIFNVMVVAQFWAFAADLYNTRSGQRLFPMIMVGLALGALAGAGTAAQAFPVVGPYPLLLLGALLLAAPLVLSSLAERAVPAASAAVDEGEREPVPPLALESVLGGFATVFRSRYLLLLAALMFLLNLINTTGEFILADFVKDWARAEAVATGRDEGRLIGQVMAGYYAWINLLSLGIQLFVVSRLFRHAGVRGGVLVLPFFLVAHYAILAVFPVFLLVRMLLVVENSLGHSLQNTINHALYLPVTREEKYLGKTTIDTFFWRFGDLAQAALVFAGLNLLGWSIRGFIVLNCALALALVAVAWRIRRSHGTVSRDEPTNLPPRIVTPLPDVHVPSGHLLMFSVPDECFVDPDRGDVLDYRAARTDGQPLPPWMRFDRHDQTFTVRPPPATSGRLTVALIARDFEGLTVTASFVLDFSPSLEAPLELPASPRS